MFRTPMLALATAVLALPSLAFAQLAVRAPSLSSDELAELAQGEVIVEVEVDGAVIDGTIVGVVDGAPADVFAVISDFANQDAWIPDMYDAEVISTSGGSVVGSGKTDTPWPIEDRVFQLEIENGPATSFGEQAFSSVWTMVEGVGNMVSNDGFWLVMPFDGDPARTLVSYRFVANAGVSAPDGMERSATQRMLPGFITGLRERLDALR